MINDGEIGLAMGDVNPETAVNRLMEAALEAGGHDNVTVIVLDVLPTTPDPTAAVLAGTNGAGSGVPGVEPAAVTQPMPTISEESAQTQGEGSQ